MKGELLRILEMWECDNWKADEIMKALNQERIKMGEMLKLEPEIFHSKDQKKIYKAIVRVLKEKEE